MSARIPETRDSAAVHLRQGGVSVILDAAHGETPRIHYWGRDLGSISDSAIASLVTLNDRPAVTNAPNAPIQVGILPEQSCGWMGAQGLLGHRAGSAFSPRLVVTAVQRTDDTAVTIDTADDAAGIAVRLHLGLTPAGLLTAQATLTNLGTDAYQLDALTIYLPFPLDAVETLDFAGRHMRERSPQRTPITIGTRVREGRRGKPGVDAAYLTAVGTAGHGFRSGETWALHVAWSGNTRTVVERSSEGVSLLGGGELLHPGEGSIEPGAHYTSPLLLASWGDGLDAVSARYHAFLRAGAGHPRTPRPVVLNTWEAVYFDQSLEKLRELVVRAGEIGAERFVLDDGWFGGRRDDTRGLGDWYVSPDVWPGGLGELIDLVHSNGMDFGLWFEPEMINLDSDLARAHPEWVMTTSNRYALAARSQQVLDLTHPQAYDYILNRIDALLTEYDIAFIKWDHNRDLVDAGHSPRGEAAVHRQTLALYQLIDELIARHPGLEIESCSSGGGRVDLGILQRAHRIWASDCIDALERQSIQRWTGLVVPPEYVGSHVGSPVAETTGRAQRLPFRAATALLGNFGIEWDITTADDAEREELAAWVAAYKKHRQLIHTGTVVHSDHADPSLWVTGVISDARDEAIYWLVTTATSEFAPLGRVTLPGLDDDRAYRVEPLQIGTPRGARGGFVEAGWWPDAHDTVGSVLTHAGIHTPVMYPDDAVLLHVTALTPNTEDHR